MPSWRWLLLFVLVYWAGRWLLKQSVFNRYRDLIYVRIGVNRLALLNVSNQTQSELLADPGFSHPRSVLGNFSIAESQLRSGLQEARVNTLLSPRVLLHPVEMVEGGLTQIEERALQELALGAGASAVKVWLGPELDAAQVAKKFKD